MNQPLKTDSPQKLDTTEVEVVDLCIRIAQFLGLPKSLGEIYGVLFISRSPLTMDDLIETLNISKGSASQGLRALKNLGAIKTQYVPGDRRDHYAAETGLGQLVSGFLRERVEPGVSDFGNRLQALKENIATANDSKSKHLKTKMEKLEHWQTQVDQFVPMLKDLLGK